MLVAIPSYKRAKTLRCKTLAMLQREGFDKKDVTVFVADEEERMSYQAELADFCPNLVVGQLGIHHQRRFIESYYPAGTRLLCMDDDVSAMKRPFNPLPLKEIFASCFRIAEEEGCGLWGISPTDNGLSLKDEAVVGLRYIIGACFGMVVPSVPLDYPRPFTEDFRRSILSFKRDGKVIRFNGLGPTTRYFKEPGGLQEFRTPEGQEAQCIEFCAEFPELTTLRRREGKPTDLRLKLVTLKRIVSPSL